MAAVCRHTVKSRRHLADASSSGHAPQLLQRKPSVAVLGCRVIAVVSDVRDAQIVIRRAGARIHREEFRRGVIGRAWALLALARLVWRRRRDEPDAAFAKGLLQRRERHFAITRPAIRCAVAERLIIFADALQIRDRLIVLRREAELLLRVAHPAPLPRSEI